MSQDADAAQARMLIPSRINHVLIDHENVQPSTLAQLDRADVRIWIFVGASQTKLSADLAMAAHRMGERVRYVRISGNGSNALDFHIAYYLGQLASQEPEAFFHILSKDTGFDPLLAHLRENGRKVYRVSDLQSLAFLPKPKVEKSTVVPLPVQPADLAVQASSNSQVKPPMESATSVKADKAVMTQVQRVAHMRLNLSTHIASRPMRRDALRNHIQAQFQKAINAQQADEIIAALTKQGVLRVDGKKVIYS